MFHRGKFHILRGSSTQWISKYLLSHGGLIKIYQECYSFNPNYFLTLHVTIGSSDTTAETQTVHGVFFKSGIMFSISGPDFQTIPNCGMGNKKKIYKFLSRQGHAYFYENSMISFQLSIFKSSIRRKKLNPISRSRCTPGGGGEAKTYYIPIQK